MEYEGYVSYELGDGDSADIWLDGDVVISDDELEVVGVCALSREQAIELARAILKHLGESE